MAFAFKSLVLLLSIFAAQGADKDKKGFQAGPVESYPVRQAVQKLTVAVDVFDTEKKTREAFGRLNPNKHGVLPILVILRNDTGETLALDDMRAEYVTATRNRVEATPAQDVKYIHGPSAPVMSPSPVPRLPGSGGRRRNPLEAWEIEGRAFAARMLTPGETASGFLYFRAAHRKGSILFVTGIREASTGNELFFIEIPLDGATQ